MEIRAEEISQVIRQQIQDFDKKVELVTPDSLSPYIVPYVKDEVVWADQG